MLLSTIGYWKFAKLLGMEVKWLLLLPVYRYAYIGMITNAYVHEGKIGGVDYSVFEVCISTIFYGCVGVYLRYRNESMSYILIAIALVWILVRYLEHYTILRLFTKHPFRWAAISWFPGVLWWRAVAAERNL